MGCHPPGMGPSLLYLCGGQGESGAQTVPKAALPLPLQGPELAFRGCSCNVGANSHIAWSANAFNVSAERWKKTAGDTLGADPHTSI